MGSCRRLARETALRTLQSRSGISAAAAEGRGVLAGAALVHQRDVQRRAGRQPAGAVQLGHVLPRLPTRRAVTHLTVRDGMQYGQQRGSQCPVS